jgi:hypothetical protein
MISSFKFLIGNLSQMTTFIEINTNLNFKENYLPNGEFILINDKFDVDGSFILLHFLNMFLNEKQQTTLVSFNHTFFHYYSIELKLVNYKINSRI